MDSSEGFEKTPQQEFEEAAGRFFEMMNQRTQRQIDLQIPHIADQVWEILKPKVEALIDEKLREQQQEQK